MSPAVAIHLACALGALALGALLLSRRLKGDRAHRILGWTWVGLMLGVAVSSLWIPGFLRLSWIHGFTALAFMGLARGVSHARCHQVRAHRHTMTSLYVGGMLVAGALALAPGRVLHRALVALFA